MKFYLLATRCLFGYRGPSRTPVRWLCLRAFDYLARCGRGPLSGEQLGLLGRAIELGVFLNRYYDGKSPFCRPTYSRLRKSLPKHETRRYLQDLRRAERGRPKPDSKACSTYRRNVSELSLRFLGRLVGLSLPAVVLTLVTQIQLLDDILDREKDERLGLPTLLSSGHIVASEHAARLLSELDACQNPSERPLATCGYLLDTAIRFLIRVKRCR